MEVDSGGSDIWTRSLSTLMVLEEDTSERENEIRRWSDGINADGGRLTHLVRGLGEYLTSSEDKTRERGLAILSSVIEKVSKLSVTRQQGLILVSFYCEKCQDPPLLKETLKGLTVLIRLPVVTSADVVTVLKELKNIDIHLYPQSTRYLVFKLYDILLDTRREVLKKESVGFVPLLIQALDGEKDPRNLLLAFDLARILLIEFESLVEDYIEQFFNVTFCYFPITFKPPPDDPYGITSDDLRNALHAALSSHPALAKYTIPAMVEKLSSSGGGVRIDTMRLFIQTLPVYGGAIVNGFQDEIWENLLIDIYQPAEIGDQDIALQCLLELLKTISQREIHQASVRPPILEKVVTSCLDELKEPAKERASHATMILAIASQSSDDNCQFLLKSTIIPLLQKSRNPDRTITEKSALLTSISKICLAATQAQPVAVAAAMYAHKDDLLGIFSAAVQDDAIQIIDAGLHGLQTMAKMTILDIDEGDYVLRLITNTLLDQRITTTSIHQSALNKLTDLAKLMPTQVQAVTFPMLFSKCPYHVPENKVSSDHALDHLVELCVRPDLLDAFVVRAMERVRALHEDGHGETKDYIIKILRCISAGIERQAKAMQEWLRRHVQRLVPDFLELLRQSPTRANTDLEIVQAVARILSQISMALDLPLQTQMCNLILDGDFDGRTQLILEAAIFGSIRAQGYPPGLDLAALLESATQSAHDTEPLIRQAGLDLLASLVNRHARKEAVEGYLSTLGDLRKTSNIKVHSSVARALLVRGEPSGYILVDRLLSLLQKPGDILTGKETAAALAYIVLNAEDHLSIKHHAVVKVLFRQRYYRYVLPKILNGASAKGADELSRSAYLQTLAALLANLSKELFLNDLPRIMPALLESIQLPDPDSALASVKLLMAVAADSTTVIGEHIDALIATLLDLARPHPPEALLAMSKMHIPLRHRRLHNEGLPLVAPPHQPARLRLAAIKALGVLSDVLQVEKVLPYRTRVIKALGRVIDDRKKVIRVQAVDTRAKWYLLNS